MKKIVAALGAILVFAGVKGQTTPVKKTTTPQEKSNNAVTTNNAEGKEIKMANTKDLTIKGSTIKLAQKGVQPSVTHKLAQKAAPSVKGTPSVNN